MTLAKTQLNDETGLGREKEREKMRNWGTVEKRPMPLSSNCQACNEKEKRS
jgi:hypothetical protein